MNDKVSSEALRESMALITAAFGSYDSMTPEEKETVREFAVKLPELIQKQERYERQLKEAKVAEQRRNRIKRQEYRDKAIPEWCRENLKPGMYVKVKGNSAMPLREVEKVYDTFLTGRHCNMVRRRDRVTREYTLEFKKGSYITDHQLYNVQAVYVLETELEKSRLIPIMDLVEGKEILQTS